MSYEPRTLIIVGGGSAGWMTAIYLNKVFNADRPNFDIKVIESPDIGVIGVGEATVHSIRFFFSAIGINESEMLQATNASLKTGILFRNWRKPANGRVHEYFHPFEQQQSGESLDLSSAWLLANGENPARRYDQDVSISATLAERGKAPKADNSRAYQGIVPYGYHIDAVLLGRYLRDKAVDAGVEHIEATVSEVRVSEGRIDAVVCGSDEYQADFFVDCTGFRGLLIESLQDDNWEDFTESLPCTRAVAVQREHPDDYDPKPYTTSTALRHGWAWQIDLVNRQGTGYVYDGERLSREQAEAELHEFLGPDSRVLQCRHLDMRVGCRCDFWVGNCIAVGLAGGFIEPLESTGLHLINLGAGLLATHLPVAVDSPSVAQSYSRMMRGFYQDLRQFIVLHYCLSDRDDTDFWRNAPATAETCPWLAAQLEIWRHKICEYHDLAGSFSTIFSDENYRYILYGMRHFPALRHDMSESMGERLFARARANAESAANVALPHGDYLRQLNQ